jgi:hypothetical protein
MADLAQLLVLHGALGSSAQLDALARALGATYRVHTLDFEGFPRTPHPIEQVDITALTPVLTHFFSASEVGAAMPSR